jgi:hypothetical protein
MDPTNMILGGQAEYEPSYNAKMTRAGGYRKPSLTENLKAQKADIESRLAEVNAALSALEQHPEVEEVLNLIAKIR